jgi:hypothetical protein
MSSENPTANVAGSSAASAPTVVLPANGARKCENCGEPLLGGHCYSCGQPTKGLVRHFSSILGDFMDSVIGLDSRIVRTIGPLFLRPGWLSTEYFAGRRVRFVSPVRLFVFLSLMAFFAARMSFDISGDEGPVVIGGQRVGPTADEMPGGADDPARDTARAGDAAAGAAGAEDDAEAAADAAQDDAESANSRPARRRLSSADTVEEVETIRAEALAAIAEGRADAKDVPGVSIGLDIAEEQVNEEADARLEAIRHSQETGEPLSMVDEEDDGTIRFNGTPWDPETNPLEFDWLPDAGNRQLNVAIGRAQQNIRHIKEDPNRLKDAVLSTVPATLFLLLPLFALFLKVAYLFKKRLYMEHLIVALHSHSFLCLSLLLVLLLDAVKAWTAGSPFVSGLLGWLETAVIVWMPTYLLLMQKRVYRQGWLMTLLKFAVLGMVYVVLIFMGFVPLLMFSLVTM